MMYDMIKEYYRKSFVLSCSSRDEMMFHTADFINQLRETYNVSVLVDGDIIVTNTEAMESSATDDDLELLTNLKAANGPFAVYIYWNYNSTDAKVTINPFPEDWKYEDTKVQEWIERKPTEVIQNKAKGFLSKILKGWKYVEPCDEELAKLGYR